MSCSTTTNGTTLAGGSARLTSGTAARPKPNPVKPRSNAAANTPNTATSRASTIVAAAFTGVAARVQACANCGMIAGVITREAAMYRDAHGLEVTAASADAVQAFDHAVMGYLTYRVDMPQRMEAAFDADAEF